MSRLTDPENKDKFIQATLDDGEKAKLARKLGQLARFTYDNPTGHYKLDLRVDTDVTLFNGLCGIAGEQVWKQVLAVNAAPSARHTDIPAAHGAHRL